MGVPTSIILPFMGIEFDATRASTGPAEMPFQGVLMGQMLATGTATAETLYQVWSVEEVEVYAGTGSMLHNMAKWWFANNDITDCFIMPIDDAVGTQATRVLTVAGTATATGELTTYINGKRIATSVAVGDAATDVGDNVVTSTAEYPYIPWTPVNSAGAVTYTATQDGIAAGDCDMRVLLDPKDRVPAGLTASFAATTPGTVDPDITNALAALGDEWFNVYVMPYDDATNLALLETHLELVFGPTYQRDGMAFVAQRDTAANLITFTNTAGRNCPHIAFLDGGDRLLSTWEFAAATGGAMAAEAQKDPGKPLHRVEIKGARPNVVGERRTFTERNSLAKNGVFTFTDSGALKTEATVTMYLENSAAAADTAYRYVNTLMVLQALRWQFNNRINSRYPRARLLTDASLIRPGLSYITPAKGKAEAIAWFKEMAREGLVEGLDQFKADITCDPADGNVNRLEWKLPPDLVNQFITGSGDMQFRL